MTGMRELVLATGNTGKLAEVRATLSDLDILIRPQSEFSVPEVEETGLTFIENAILKARSASRHAGLPALADDSGLEVDALDGAPGIYSARFAGPEANDADNNRALLEALAEVPADARSARFQCVLVLMEHWKDPTPRICQGTWAGRILFEERGKGGFGYDPLFLPDGLALSSAELAPDMKNRISHRGLALAALSRSLRG